MNLLTKIFQFFVYYPVAQARNDTGERIESLRFTVPALRVGVLEYAPGQLTTNNKQLDGKTVKLYYPPEAVSDEKFLKSLQTAPVVVGGHGSTTNENNKKIDGWAHTVSYDSSKKAAMISGIVKGNKEVSYIKDNINGDDDFGASAFIDIFEMKVESGVTPDGQPYNAVALDIRATHVALAQHVRDPENKIKVTNAVVVNTSGNYKREVNKVEMTPEQIAAIVENAVTKAVTAKNDTDRIAKLEAMVKNLAEENEEMKKESAKNEKEDEEKDKKKVEAENEDDEKKKDEEKEGATLENAKPSQALVAAVGTAMNIDFGAKTPSFASLALLLGIKEADPCARIAAVNAKFSEMSKSIPASGVTASNTVEVF